MVARLLALILVLFCAVGPADAAADPKVVIERFCAVLLDVMKQGPQLGFKGRLEKLQPAFAAAYDMAAVSRGSLGAAAGKLSAEELGRVAEAYERFSVATYADQFTAWEGERFEVGAARPMDGGAMLVPSRIIPAKGDPTSIDYVMRAEGDGWRIVDVLFDGAISQVAVRRSEFSPIFRRDGLAGLIATLDAKTKSLETK
ncbi:MAG TPA: organic solvent ABC transporter [Rhodospirillaceae bacterium]|nr:organic solvent ABC transporter [Rhodospirillaceae bacterium]